MNEKGEIVKPTPVTTLTTSILDDSEIKKYMEDRPSKLTKSYHNV